MRVKTNPGQQCPKEHNPREYIGDAEDGVEVENSAYYLRLIADGSLVEVVNTKKAKGDN